MAQKDPFKALRPFTAGGQTGSLYSLPALEQAGLGKISRLPVSVRLVLESVLRNCDGKKVTEAHVRQLANWKPNAARTDEIPFVVARIVLQDFTGVPLLVDLAAMREAVARLGKDSSVIEPLVPVDLVVDHSVQVDRAGSANAFLENLRQEFGRNTERYEFLKWGMQAFKTFGVVPPAIGIVHQVNLEHLAKLSDPLARAQVWGSAWDATRDGESSATDFINLVLNNVATENQGTMLITLLRQLVTTTKIYTTESKRHDSIVDVCARLLDLASKAEPGSDNQLLFTRFATYLADIPAHGDVLEGLLNGSVVFEGLKVDQDMRWDIVA